VKIITLIKKNSLIGSLTYFMLISSCVPSNKLRYFNDIYQLSAKINNPREHKLIMPFDRINIQVFSIDEKTKQLFYDNNIDKAEVDNSSYIVTKEGSLRFPLVGKIDVVGLTLEEAGIKLEEALNTYVSDVNVTLTFAESKVTVMGEVNNQGTFSFTQDKLNIYEALTLGGGISQYGDRKKVVLIRQNGDDIKYYNLDLSNSEIGKKDYYFIESNDVIVVEPLNSASWFKFNSSSFNTVLSSLTTILVLYSYLIIFGII
jgi:polysaccharide biosynthesis/export protein